MSGFLLDTNIISEFVKPRREPRVMSWLESVDENLLHLSVLSLGEIRKGLVMLPEASRRVAIEAWLETDLRRRFAGRILPVTEDIADRWGTLAGNAAAMGRPVSVIDGFLAATALQHNLTLVTRNTADILHTGVSFFNPWEPPGSGSPESSKSQPD